MALELCKWMLRLKESLNIIWPDGRDISWVMGVLHTTSGWYKESNTDSCRDIRPRLLLKSVRSKLFFLTPKLQRWRNKLLMEEKLWCIESPAWVNCALLASLKTCLYETVYRQLTQAIWISISLLHFTRILRSRNNSEIWIDMHIHIPSNIFFMDQKLSCIMFETRNI